MTDLTDRTSEIASEAARKDPRIIVINRSHRRNR